MATRDPKHDPGSAPNPQPAIPNNEILENLAFDPAEGSLRYRGVRYLLVRPETLDAFRKTVADADPALAEKALFDAGHTGGSLSGKKYREDLGLSAREAVEFMCDMGTQIGWGAFHIESFEEAAMRLDVRVDASPFTHAPSAIRGPSCHLIRGVLAGLTSYLFGGPVDARETECRTAGAPTCRFVCRGTAP